LDQHDSNNDRGVRLVLPAPSADPLGEVKAGRFMNVGHKARFDPFLTIPESSMRRLTFKRALFDAAEHVHHAGIRLLRRIGVDR
jgi:hypothetical protein